MILTVSIKGELQGMEVIDVICHHLLWFMKYYTRYFSGIIIRSMYIHLYVFLFHTVDNL